MEADGTKAKVAEEEDKPEEPEAAPAKPAVPPVAKEEEEAGNDGTDDDHRVTYVWLCWTDGAGTDHVAHWVTHDLAADDCAHNATDAGKEGHDGGVDMRRRRK